MPDTIENVPEVLSPKKILSSSTDRLSNPVFQPDWKLKIIGGSAEINAILFESGYPIARYEASEDATWRAGADGVGVMNDGFIHPILAGSMHADANLLDGSDAPGADKSHFLGRRWEFLSSK